MGMDDCLADRQAQADATASPCPPGIHPVEPVEDPRQVLGRDADPGVGHSDDGKWWVTSARSRFRFSVFRGGTHLWRTAPCPLPLSTVTEIVPPDGVLVIALSIRLTRT